MQYTLHSNKYAASIWLTNSNCIEHSIRHNMNLPQLSLMNNVIKCENWNSDFYWNIILYSNEFKYASNSFKLGSHETVVVDKYSSNVRGKC